MNFRAAVVGSFFLLLLLTGNLCFKDYGINWDEPVHQWRGQAFLDYVLEGDRRLIESEIQRSYGPFPDVVLAAVERAFSHQKDTRILFLSRRLVLFLIFYLGVVFFFLLGQKIFQSWAIGLMGSLFLVLSPRIFVHAFHNAKDIPLMAAMIVAFYTLVRYLEKPGSGRLVVHALACAVVTNIRITGIFVVLLTGAAFLIVLWESRRNRASVCQFLKHGLVFGLLFAFATVVLWPTLWEDPASRFFGIIRFSANLPWGGKLLYLGQFFRETELPWHYIPVWIFISTPLLYLGLFAVGLPGLFFRLFRKIPSEFRSRLTQYLILLWFIVPPSLTVVLEVHTFDEWRHLFYIYPPFLLISLGGLVTIHNAAAKFLAVRPATAARIGPAALCLAILGGAIPAAIFMIRNHPHENVYFNRLAGRDMANVAKRFELDYWGISYKQGLEYVLKTDPSERIRVAVDNRPGEFNSMILPQSERERLVYVQPVLMPIVLNRDLQKFANRRAGRYAIGPADRRLIIRSPMTAAEREELLRIFPDPSEKEAVERAYRESQALGEVDYFLTNYRLHPGEFPLEKVHSIDVGNAPIMGIYRFTPSAEAE